MQPLMREVRLSASLADLYGSYAAEPYSIFLDSARNAYGMGRFSFVMRQPFLRLRYKGGRGCWIWADGRIENFTGPLWPELKQRVAAYPVFPMQIPFVGGAVGYFAYDLAYEQESLPGVSADDRELADCSLGFYDSVVAYDHETEQCFILASGWPEKTEALRKQRANESLAAWEEVCAACRPLPLLVRPQPVGPYRTNFKKKQYCRQLAKAIEYIYQGDIFQVNLSQRFTAPYTGDPFAVYRYLREINPAPFAAYLQLGECVVASASPERFLKIESDNVETRPIKGTRPRGTTAAEDSSLRRELLHSEKDQAELVMIIDLMRNDLGKVCRFGSVKVPEVFCCEEYATVFHLVSTVQGRLRQGFTAVDQLAAAFPPGSITGAPKVRAMEIIDELEPLRRNVYTGSIGYLSFCGKADWNVAIRSLVFQKQEAWFQVGGGIVADSQPEAEYQETLDKAKALLWALGYAT